MNMNKTLIALAIAAALPVAAQADATLSGTLTSKYKSLDSSIDTDSRLTVASSEVLTNGMTATASFLSRLTLMMIPKTQVQLLWLVTSVH